ncbi:hypothetical protein RDG78_002110 [Vibrio vulnificus]|nr:hypothetical protein [Vibrio vulnificus]
MGRQARIERLALRRNIHNSQMRINWAEEVLSELKDIDCLL